jgi:hypothetical protein
VKATLGSNSERAVKEDRASVIVHLRIRTLVGERRRRDSNRHKPSENGDKADHGSSHPATAMPGQFLMHVGLGARLDRAKR